MEDKQMNFLMYTIGFVGLIVLLGGAFNLYEFKYGLIVALILWFIAGSYKHYNAE